MHYTNHMRGYQLVANLCFYIFKKIPHFLQETESAVPTGLASLVSVEAQRKNLIRASSISDKSKKREALSKEYRDPCVRV